MNEWEIAAAVLGAGLIPCLAVCALTGVASGLVALEVASVLVTTILMLLSEGLQRQPFIDLALTFAFGSLVGALVFARLLERDL
ncbi:MAG TPA: monovalent cation/H+ antiporter complex subunit F [Solirubrobacteraceae bacterium]|jgi:multisubunit Na+/H+ antiporter MnhF subunit|nr:monovalent cation/H+ antiporter complex subunit F [Solirubrobacteraceae bacterium]